MLKHASGARAPLVRLRAFRGCWTRRRRSSRATWGSPIRDTVPHAVVLVVSRMVARALTTAVSEGATSEAAGPYTVGYRDGAASLWLSKNDKLALRSISGGASSVRFVSERGFYCDGS
jgi:hypothetical protein